MSDLLEENAMVAERIGKPDVANAGSIVETEPHMEAVRSCTNLRSERHCPNGAQKDISGVENVSMNVGWYCRYKEPISNVCAWMGYCVCFALMLFMGRLLISYAVKEPFDLKSTLVHGELLGVCIAIMGEALGDLLKNPRVSNTLKSVLCFPYVLVLLSCSFLFSILIVPELHVDADYVMYTSLTIFMVVLIVGGLCKWIGK